IGLLMRAVLENVFCIDLVTTVIYTTTPNEFNPEGLTLSNLFVRRIEDRDTGSVQVIGGKTGYVQQSGNCAVSYAVTEDGAGYICVTGSASSSWRAIYDHTALYDTYCDFD
ncbi:MAG: D-alanyl-D-alanine carboxypeptidase, partial [Oscillospiraceae bacterium]|nr:D-alanyl-D-alanine carboxypeptidase [Oscillospiraceae bacterium]